MSENNTIQNIIDMAPNNIDPQHPIGSSILKRVSNKERHSPEICLAWADRLLSKKDEGEKYLNAGSDWLGRSMDNAELDRKPDALFIKAEKLAEKHFNQDTVVTVLERAIKHCPSDNRIKDMLINESYKLAKAQLKNNAPTVAKETIDRLIELVPETLEYKGIIAILNKANAEINTCYDTNHTQEQSEHHQSFQEYEA